MVKRFGAGLFLCAVAVLSHAQNLNFAVTVNPGLMPPNATTVFPGEETSVRISLQNNGNTAITNASYSGSLPDSGSASLVAAGAGTTTCAGAGSVTATQGDGAIAFTGLDIPANGECFVDVPLRARSVNGSGTTLSYAIGETEVSSDDGANATGGNQAYTVRGVSRPVVSKSFVGSNLLILGDSASTQRITVSNPDAGVDLSGIAFADIFPAAGGSAIFEPENTTTAATGSCIDNGGAVALTQGASAGINVSNVDLAAGDSCTIDVQVRGRQTDGSYQINATNRIGTASFSSDQGLTPATDATATVRVRSPLGVQKAFSPTVLASGEQGNFTIRLSNAADDALTVATFTDDPIGDPAGGLSIDSVADVSNSCGGGAALAGSGTGFTVSSFPIPANGSCAITVTYTGVVDDAEIPITYTNAIPEGAVVIDGDPGIISQAESATVIVADRLRVLKNRTPANAAPGDPVNYSVIIQNYSNAAISGVSLEETLQNNSTLLTAGAFQPSVSAACGVLATNGAATGDVNIDFTIPTVPARSAPGTPGTCTVSFWAMIDPDATTNTSNRIDAGGVCFIIGGNEICNGGASNTVTTNFRSPVDFIKTIDGANNTSKLEGLPARLRLELRNFAAEPLNSVSFSDTLPDDGPFQQLQVASPANLSNSCGGTVTAVPGSSSVSLNGGTVSAVGGGGSPGTCAMEVDIVGPAGSYDNLAEATGIRPNADGTSTNIGTQEDSATISYTPALQSSKLFTPESTGDGGLSTLEIRFENLDENQPITGIEATDDLPAGMTVASPANAYTTCAGGASISAVPGSSTVAISGASLAPDSSCAVLVDVVAEGTSDWVNSIAAGDITADNGIVNTTAVTATLRYEPSGVPLISKSITPGTIAPGQTATLTVLITNDSAQDLSNLGLVDWFTEDGTEGGVPNGMYLGAPPQATTSCAGGVVTGAPEGESLRLSGASIAAGADCTFSAQVSSRTVGTIVNRIPESTITSDQSATNSSTFAESSLSTTSDFGVSKRFTPSVVGADEPSRLRIEFLNGSETAVTNFTLTDVYPAGLENAPTPNPITNCGAGTLTVATSSITITGGTLGAAVADTAANCFVEVDVVAATEDTYINTIPADSTQVEGSPLPHPEATGELQVRQRIIVNKAFDAVTLDAGDPNGFSTGVAARLPGAAAPLTIRLENPNTIPLTEVAFTDTLPDGLVLAVPANLATTCTDGVVTGNANGRELTLASASLAQAGSAGDICTVTADVYSNVAATYTNEIAEGDVTSFEGVDNAPRTQAQIVISEPPVVRKEFLPPVIAPDAASTLRITLLNDNDAPGTLEADLVDALPASPGAMMVAASPALSIDPACPNLNVSAAAGATSVVVENGSVLPPGGCVISVDVTASEPGDYLNVIPVGALRTSFGSNDQRAEGTLKVSTRGYIAGKVFLDNQIVPDGAFVPGDSDPLAGIAIELRDGADCAGALRETAITDASGNYLFAELPAGSYSVCQPAQPMGTLNSVTTEGVIVPFGASTGTPGTAANPSATSSRITGIVLGDNNGNADEVSGSPDNNFSEILPARVSGNVYFDANNNGSFDAGETGIAGVTIELSGPVNLTTTTAADGSWRFEGLPAGEYTATEVQPGGWTDGQDTRGTVGGTGVGSASNDVIGAITLGPGDAGIDYNFGEIVPGGEGALSVTANAVCINDVAYVDYSLAGFGPSAPAVTIRWITPDGRVVEERNVQPGAGRALWPGSSVDASGNGTGWPGWAFVDGAWVEVPDDRRPDLTFEIEFNPTASVSVTYPPATQSCAAQPLGTFRLEPVPVMPRWVFLLAALGLVALGSRRLALARRG